MKIWGLGLRRAAPQARSSGWGPSASVSCTGATRTTPFIGPALPACPAHAELTGKLLPSILPPFREVGTLPSPRREKLRLRGFRSHRAKVPRPQRGFEPGPMAPDQPPLTGGFHLLRVPVPRGVRRFFPVFRMENEVVGGRGLAPDHAASEPDGNPHPVTGDVRHRADRDDEEAPDPRARSPD